MNGPSAHPRWQKKEMYVQTALKLPGRESQEIVPVSNVICFIANVANWFWRTSPGQYCPWENIHAQEAQEGAFRVVFRAYQRTFRKILWEPSTWIQPFRTLGMSHCRNLSWSALLSQWIRPQLGGTAGPVTYPIAYLRQHPTRSNEHLYEQNPRMNYPAGSSMGARTNSHLSILSDTQPMVLTLDSTQAPLTIFVVLSDGTCLPYILEGRGQQNI